MNLTCYRIHAFTQDPFGGESRLRHPVDELAEDGWLLQMAGNGSGRDRVHRADPR